MRNASDLLLTLHAVDVARKSLLVKPTKFGDVVHDRHTTGMADKLLLGLLLLFSRTVLAFCRRWQLRFGLGRFHRLG